MGERQLIYETKHVSVNDQYIKVASQTLQSIYSATYFLYRHSTPPAVLLLQECSQALASQRMLQTVDNEQQCVTQNRKYYL